MSFRVLIAGGGPAAVEAVLTLRELAPDVSAELLCPDEELVYRPLSVLEPFARAAVRRYPLASLGTPVHRGRLAGVEVGARVAVTEAGGRIPYDALLIATGVRRVPLSDDVITFTGPAQSDAMHGLVQDVEDEYSRSVAFLAPKAAGWYLPLYELALQTAERAAEMSAPAELSLTTPESEPMEVFGLAATDLVSGLLERAGVRFVSGTEPPPAARTVALGVPEPPSIDGLPPGFLAADETGAVTDGVWAAGDVTDRPLRQGGLAAQQAAAAASAIAVEAGAGGLPEPYTPVLRALLIAGRRGYFLRRRLDGIDLGQASHRALWWPPSKIAGERLAPFLDALDAEESVERRLAGERVKRRAIISPDTRGPLS